MGRVKVDVVRALNVGIDELVGVGLQDVKFLLGHQLNVLGRAKQCFVVPRAFRAATAAKSRLIVCIVRSMIARSFTPCFCLCAACSGSIASILLNSGPASDDVTKSLRPPVSSSMAGPKTALTTWGVFLGMGKALASRVKLSVTITA